MGEYPAEEENDEIRMSNDEFENFNAHSSLAQAIFVVSSTFSDCNRIGRGKCAAVGIVISTSSMPRCAQISRAPPLKAMLGLPPNRCELQYRATEFPGSSRSPGP